MNNFDKSSILKELHQDEEELHKDERLIKITFVIIAILILAIVGIASYLIFKSITDKKPVTTVVNKIIRESILVTQTISPSPVSEIPSPTKPVVVNTTNIKSTASKDYYINIGTGVNKSSDWTDVGGAITTADIGQYQNIKDVYFETSINVPSSNGTVSVRLYNTTDKHPVWNSEVTKNGTSDTYLFVSPSVSYDVGPKMYQVQMKSQLNVAANLVQSRLHIVTK